MLSPKERVVRMNANMIYNENRDLPVITSQGDESIEQSDNTNVGERLYKRSLAKA